MIYLIVYKNSNVPIIAYEDKEEMLNKIRRMKRKEERLLKRGLITEEFKGDYTFKVIKLRRKKNVRNN